jgi:D-glycero-D-manno-heptose 1,7-bisphosphate phosphatase
VEPQLNRKAVFFDKDGTLNRDNGDLFQPPYIEAVDVIAYLRRLGYMIFIITNQTGVARGLETMRSLQRRMHDFSELITAINNDAIIDGVFFCPHHPDAQVKEYRVKCDCRKPRPGLIHKAQDMFKIELTESWMIGDRLSDIKAGQLAGCRTIQVLSDKSNENIETDIDLTGVISEFAVSPISVVKEIIK